MLIGFSALQYFHNIRIYAIQANCVQPNMRQTDEKHEGKEQNEGNEVSLEGDKGEAHTIKNRQRMQRFKLSTRKVNSFTKEQLIIFANSFEAYRSKWGLYTKNLQKTEKQIKNLFYNSLRKLATQLSNMQKKMRLFQKNKIQTLILHHLINISYTVKDSFDKMDIGVQQLLIFKVKEKIFDYCFRGIQPTETDLFQLSKNVRKLKFYLKNMKLVKSADNEKQAIRLAETMLQRQSQGCCKPKIRNSRIVVPTEPSPPSQFQSQMMQEESVINNQCFIQSERADKHTLQCLCQQCEYRNLAILNQTHYQYIPPFQLNYYPLSLPQSYPYYPPYQFYPDYQEYPSYPKEIDGIKPEISKLVVESEGDKMQKPKDQLRNSEGFHNEIKIKMKSEKDVNKKMDNYESIVLVRKQNDKNEQQK